MNYYMKLADAAIGDKKGSFSRLQVRMGAILVCNRIRRRIVFLLDFVLHTSGILSS